MRFIFGDLAVPITSQASLGAECRSRWSYANACVDWHSYTSGETHYFHADPDVADPAARLFRLQLVFEGWSAEESIHGFCAAG